MYDPRRVFHRWKQLVGHGPMGQLQGHYSSSTPIQLHGGTGAVHGAVLLDASICVYGVRGGAVPIGGGERLVRA